jgi:sugar/nucleoside kinase (ribokinase family)
MDPTGAGDSFAGGFLGFLSSQENRVDDATLRRAMVYGTVLASFNVEQFGTERVAKLSRDEVDARFEDLRAMTAVEAVTPA